MSILSTLVNFTAGYSPLESYLFDRLFKNATAALHDHALCAIEPALTPGTRVLDVGCGGGRFAIRLAERFPGVRVVGLDLSPEQIARAQQRGAALAERVSFVQGTATDMPFADEDFDLVYSLGSIKHWPDPAKGLRECTRVLRPSGRLWVMEGDRGCRHEDVHRFISTWNIPVRARPLAVAFYRTVVVGKSFDLNDARLLLMEVPDLEGTIERAPGLPVWVIAGNKRRV